jgi:hypothetical protein
MTAFLDFPAESYEQGLAFWQAATSQVPSAARGDHDEFRTLLPITGDDFLRVQRLGEGDTRVHLDLHVDDQTVARERAAELGARLVHDNDYATFHSPAGVVFCTVSQPCSRPPTPADWGGHLSLIDRVGIDVPAALHPAECAFWSAMLGWPPVPGTGPGVVELARPEGQPLGLRLWAVPDATEVRVQLDVATDDRRAEVRRLTALGADKLAEGPAETLMQGPAGVSFRVSERLPRADLPEQRRGRRERRQRGS